jgi:hypothetical protein
MRGRRRRAITLTALTLTALPLFAGCRWSDPWPGRPPGRPAQPTPTATPTTTPAGSPSVAPATPSSATPSITVTGDPTPTPPPGPVTPVTLPSPLPAATGLQPLGTTPAPPPGWTGGVATLTPDGQFVVWERRLDTSDDAGNLRRTPTRIGIAAPGGAATWFRPEPADPAQVRLVTAADAAGDWVVWREEPFREATAAGTVLASHDRATGAVVELARFDGSRVQKPVIAGERAYWEQYDTQTGAVGIWSVALTGGTPRLEVPGGSHAAADRCGTEPALLYATTAADGSHAVVHRRSAAGGTLGPDTTVLTRTLGRGLAVLGVAACDDDVAVATGRPGALDLPEWAEGRILVQGAGGAVDIALPTGFTGRELVLTGRLLGFVTVPHSMFGPQDQVIFDRATNAAASLGTNGPGRDVLQTSAVQLAAGGVVAWVGVVNLTYLQGTAARYPD